MDLFLVDTPSDTLARNPRKKCARVCADALVHSHHRKRFFPRGSSMEITDKSSIINLGSLSMTSKALQSML